MRILFSAVMAFAVLGGPAAAAPLRQAAATGESRPTIVLVHGAFAESASWNGVVGDLTREGYPVVAAAGPLRGVAADADYLSGLIGSLSGPIVLVGHSYGGEVISVAAANQPSVKALVFVAAFAPEVGESAASLSALYPTGTLGDALAAPVPTPGGGFDLYIEPLKYRAQFAADVPPEDAVAMAATQRPIAESALGEPAAAQAWGRLPSWFIWGELDRNIPSDLHAFMARRAGAREAIEVPGASHVVMISNPRAVSALIIRAASQIE